MKILLRPALVLATAWLAGCAAGGATRPAEETSAAAPAAGAVDEKLVEQRAVKRWELLIAGKAGEAYDYLSPGFRALKAREQYVADLQNRPVRWKGVRFTSLDCPPPGEFCDVTLDVDYEMNSPLQGVGVIPATGPVTERWIVLDGVWYLVPKEVARN
jgi:hypothetical protein